MVLSLETLKTHNWTELSWRDTFYNAQVRLKTRLDHGFAIEYVNVFPMIITHTIVTITVYKAV